VPVLHLSPAEIGLLRTVLGAGGTRFAIVRGEVVAPLKDEAEVVAAVRWARGLHADEVTDDDDGDGFEPSGREPVVKPPRGALADGRHEASRWRRLSGGLLDETLVGAPIVLAAWAGASAWWLVLLHLLYTVVPMLGWGWTIGKLCTRTRVIDRTSLGLPSPAAVLARWWVAAVPVLGGVSGLLHGDLIGLAALVVYAPVMVCLRGLHDLAAGTVVVERYPRD
jgi:uncharacterized RDD family membrane protein YckC